MVLGDRIPLRQEMTPVAGWHGLTLPATGLHHRWQLGSRCDQVLRHSNAQGMPRDLICSVKTSLGRACTEHLPDRSRSQGASPHLAVTVDLPEERPGLDLSFSEPCAQRLGCLRAKVERRSAAVLVSLAAADDRCRRASSTSPRQVLDGHRDQFTSPSEKVSTHENQRSVAEPAQIVGNALDQGVDVVLREASGLPLRRTLRAPESAHGKHDDIRLRRVRYPPCSVRMTD